VQFKLNHHWKSGETVLLNFIKKESNALLSDVVPNQSALLL